MIYMKKKSKECHKQSIMNRFIRSIPPKREKKIEYESTQYINRVYFNKYEETKNN